MRVHHSSRHAYSAAQPASGIHRCSAIATVSRLAVARLQASVASTRAMRPPGNRYQSASAPHRPLAKASRLPAATIAVRPAIRSVFAIGTPCLPSIR